MHLNQVLNKDDTKKYELAGPFKRVFVRLLDFLFISIIGLLFSLLFFINSKFTIKDMFLPITNTTPVLDGWRIFMITITVFIFTFLYFNILPYYWKGYTIFKFLFKIRIFTKNQTKSFFWLLFKHEFLIWFLIMIFNVGFGLACVIVQNPFELIKYLFNFNIDLSDKSVTTSVYFALGVFFKTMYAFTSIIPAILVGYMFFHQRKKGFHDIISETFVYSTTPIIDQKTEIKEENEIQNSWELPGLNNIGVKKVDLSNDINKTTERYEKNKKQKELLKDE